MQAGSRQIRQGGQSALEFGQGAPNKLYNGAALQSQPIELLSLEQDETKDPKRDILAREVWIDTTAAQKWPCVPYLLLCDGNP